MRSLFGFMGIFLATTTSAASIFDSDGQYGGVYACRVTASAGVEYKVYEGKWEAKVFPTTESFTVTVTGDGLGSEKYSDERIPAYQYTVVITDKGSSGRKCTYGVRNDEAGRIKMTVPLTGDGTIHCSDGFNDYRMELDGLAFEIKGERGDLVSLSRIALDTVRYVKVGTCERM